MALSASDSLSASLPKSNSLSSSVFFSESPAASGNPAPSDRTSQTQRQSTPGGTSARQFSTGPISYSLMTLSVRQSSKISIISSNSSTGSGLFSSRRTISPKEELSNSVTKTSSPTGNLPLSINLRDMNGQSQFILLSNSSGIVGGVFIPRNLHSSTNVTLIIESVPESSGRPIANSILDITLVDEDGQAISQLNFELTVCFPKPEGKKNEQLCLSYYDETRDKWICQDKCLTKPENKDSLLCGQTDHLTNFALLFTGSNGKKDEPCQSDNPGHVLSWLSLGFVSGAFLIIILSVPIIEVYYRKNAKKRHNFEGVLNLLPYHFRTDNELYSDRSRAKRESLRILIRYNYA